MTEASRSLVFVPTPVSLAVGAVFVIGIAVLALMAWRRSGFRRATGWLELLRVVIAVGIAITLNQPEWREVFRPDSKPVLAVLWDQSRSMETRDATPAGASRTDPISRAESIRPLTDPAAWNTLASRIDVVIEPFSSHEEPPLEATDIDRALSGALEKHPRLAAVVLATDGTWNSGESPSHAATRLRMREIPVFAVPAGAGTKMPDVELVSFEVPTFAVAGKPLRIPFTIESSLPRDESATLEMNASGGERVTKEVTIKAMSRLQDTLLWRPDKPGDVTLTLRVPKTGAETLLENNLIEAPLAVRKEELKVLVIDTYPRWEYRYLRNALERDPGVSVNCLLFHPGLGQPGAGRGYLESFPKDDELAKYDVVFLGDVGLGNGQLAIEHCAALQKLVRDQAAGLVFVPGLRGHEGTLLQTPLADLFPIVWDDAQPRGWGSSAPGKFALTEAGARSLLTKLEDSDEASARLWSTLPGFQWYAPALRGKAGSEVLATHGTESNRFGRVPLIVTKTYGAGKILFMGADGAWRWRRGVEDKYHYRFWGQVVRWMAYQRNMARGENMRLFFSPDRPRTDDVLTLNANVMSLAGEPLRDGVVMVRVAAPSGKTSSVRLMPAGEEAWGLFTGTFAPREPGPHRVLLNCADSGSSLETVISVQGTRKEKTGQPARLDVLREIAQITRGKVLESSDPGAVAAAVAALPEPEPQERRIQLWANPLWAGLLILLMGAFWAGRKVAGVF